MLTDQPNYESYLLRLWQVRQDGKTVWRASLESTRTGARENFADVKQAFAFLRVSLQGKQGQGVSPPQESERIRSQRLMTPIRRKHGNLPPIG